MTRGGRLPPQVFIRGCLYPPLSVREDLPDVSVLMKRGDVTFCKRLNCLFCLLYSS